VDGDLEALARLAPEDAACRRDIGVVAAHGDPDAMLLLLAIVVGSRETQPSSPRKRSTHACETSR
jgi:hypothetical protein